MHELNAPLWTECRQNAKKNAENAQKCTSQKRYQFVAKTVLIPSARIAAAITPPASTMRAPATVYQLAVVLLPAAASAFQMPWSSSGSGSAQREAKRQL